jgi:hypothetical protein
MTAPSAEVSTEWEAERTWIAERLQRIDAAARPAAHGTWCTPTQQRGMSFLAKVDGVLIEAHADHVYRSSSTAGYVAVLHGLDDPTQYRLRAGELALAFAAATMTPLAAVEIRVADGSIIRIEDMANVMELARATLWRISA